MGDAACVQALPDRDGTRIIVCSGEFDIDSHGALAEAMNAARLDGVKRTVLDMHLVSFADSSMLNTLLVAHRRQHLVLAGPFSPQIARLLTVTGTDKVLTLAADLADACTP
ncbi:STAS domain-containing protein [Streptomyces sp. cmx-4-9]|uniref:STAS domain-containing protein n=1 Tax=Streptomyces sp. cmx-4-9 TaxID=2790941 RepID=UPI00397EF623